VLDGAEFRRWRQAAADHLAVARHDAAGGFHSAAVLHGEQAAQCGLKALLHGVGAPGAARHHGLLRLADVASELAALRLDSAVRDDISRLAREYLPSRYPDALLEGTPAAHYRSADAQWALTTAEAILAHVDQAWTALTANTDRQ
jgi:HEPN domain-containing protein